jgi:CheY-like chemotaxis protein/tetratricopeptide (TPR) repeat protein
MAGRILLAEDNTSLALILRQFLEGQGHVVTSAHTGAAAMAALEGGSFDLLILDLHLPVLSGVDILRRIRASSRWNDLPVIVISGVYRGEKYTEAARRLGIRHYLEKPFTRQTLLDAVSATLPLPLSNPALPLSDLLVATYDEQKSGILILPGGLPVVLHNGEPCSFISRGRVEFPSFLVDRGTITPAELREFVDADAGRIYFTETGLLTYDELTETSRLFLVQALTAALEANEPAGFSAGGPETESPPVCLQLPRLLYDAYRNSAPRFDGGPFFSRYDGAYPARTHLFFRRANLVLMHKEEIELLGWINGTATLHEILAHGHSPKEVAAFFSFLISLGMIRFLDAPAAEPTPDFPQKNLFNRPLEELKDMVEELVSFEDLVDEVAATVEEAVGDTEMGAPLSCDEIDFEQSVQRDFAAVKEMNYYQLFGFAPGDFSIKALKEAYFAKTRQYSPEKFMELSGPTLELAQEVLGCYADAYGTLSSVVAKERYDEMLNAGVTTGIDGKQDDRLQARVQFQSGMAFFHMGEFDNAEKTLRDAYNLEPESHLHAAWLAWAIYHNPANKNSRGAREKALTLLGKSLRYGKSAEAFAFRGWMLLEEGRDGLAEGEFLKALKINPREATACKGLKMIEERRETEKKGLFRKIFS